MKKALLAVFAILCLSASLTGCVVEPLGMGGGGHYHHDHG